MDYRRACDELETHFGSIFIPEQLAAALASAGLDGADLSLTDDEARQAMVDLYSLFLVGQVWPRPSQAERDVEEFFQKLALAT